MQRPASPINARARVRRWRRSAVRTAAAFALGAAFAVIWISPAEAAATAVPLGAADSFAVLAGSGVTNTGPTTLNGDIGTFPTTTITGSASLTVNGTNHAGDAVTQQAKTDLVTAYTNAAGQGPTSPIVADLGGQTLAAGVYNSASSIGITGALTLNGAGNPNAVFVFQAGSTLTTAAASQVVLTNGTQACNVFWQVGSAATLGTGSTLRGSVLALTSITLTSGVTVNGRVLARNGAVTLDTDTITKPTCAAQVTTTTTTPTSTTTTGVPVTTTTQPATATTVTTAPATPSTTAPAVRPTATPPSGSGGGNGNARRPIRSVGFTG